MPFLEDVKSVATSISLVAVPVVVAFIANSYTQAIKDQEVGAKFVEMALGVLEKEPTPEYANIREWAVRIIDTYSNVPMSPAERQDIVTELSLPTVSANPLPAGFRDVAEVRKIDEIIVQDTQSTNVANEIAGLKQAKVAYHYLIDVSGKIMSLVDDNDIAFHTSGHNDSSIGIGMMHISGSSYPPAQIDALRTLVQGLMSRYSIPADKVISSTGVSASKRSDFDAIRTEIVTQ